MSIQASTTSASALNRLLVARGGQEIPGLENCPAGDVQALANSLAKFDEFAAEVSSNPIFGALANSEATKFLRDLAKTLSTQAQPDATPTNATPVFQGFCGGARPTPPPPAPTPPPAAQTPPPAAQTPPPAAQTPPPALPPVVAQPPSTPPPVTALGAPSGNVQALGTAAAATPAGSTAAPAGSANIGSLFSAFGQGLGQLLSANPLGSLLAAGALGNLLGNFNPFALNSAQNGGTAQAMSTGGTNQTATPTTGATPNTGNAELDALLAGGGKGMTFEDKVALMMCQIIKKMQDDIEKRLEKLKAQAEAAEKEGGSGGGGGFLGGLMGGGGGGMLGSILGMAGNMIMPGIGGAIGGMAGNMLGGAMGGGGGGGAGGAGGGGKSSESRNLEFEMLKNEMQKLSQMQQAFSNVLNEMHQLAMSSIRNIKT